MQMKKYLTKYNVMTMPHQILVWSLGIFCGLHEGSQASIYAAWYFDTTQLKHRHIPTALKTSNRWTDYTDNWALLG